MLAARNSVGYETVKTGIIGMTREMAVDFGPEGVRVNGAVNTAADDCLCLLAVFHTPRALCSSHLPGPHRAQAQRDRRPRGQGCQGERIPRRPVRRRRRHRARCQVPLLRTMALQSKRPGPRSHRRALSSAPAPDLPHRNPYARDRQPTQTVPRRQNLVSAASQLYGMSSAVVAGRGELHHGCPSTGRWRAYHPAAG